MVRYFIYADKDKIFEIYNQLFANIKEFDTNSEENKVCGLKAEIDLPNILQGFLPFNFSGEMGRDCTNTFSAKIEVSIEEKIMSLISIAKGNEAEPVETWSPKGTLVVGSAKILQYDYFERKIKKFLKKDKCKKFIKYVDKNGQKRTFDKKWNRLILENDLCNCKGNGMPAISFLNGISEKRTTTEKFIAVNWKYPTIIDFSLNKMLISASSLANANFFAHTTDIGILGIIRNCLPGLYRIKPIAMWEVIELDKCDKSFIMQTKDFKRFWSTKRFYQPSNIDGW